jgi:hypothetical protein
MVFKNVTAVTGLGLILHSDKTVGQVLSISGYVTHDASSVEANSVIESPGTVFVLFNRLDLLQFAFQQDRMTSSQGPRDPFSGAT